MKMKYAEDKEKGLKALSLDNTNENILKFGRMKYCGNLKYYISDSCLNLEDFISWLTKKEAQEAAKRIGFSKNHVEKIGSRFCQCWGIRHDLSDNYFLATYE